MDIFESAAARPLLKIVITGHVDHGKSTLVGRLLHDTGTLPEGKIEALKRMAERRGMPLEWAFLLDALQAERDQGITIDTTQIRFSTPHQDYVLIDAPGHKEFLKNMITGAAAADAAILVIDAQAGLEEQTRRHAYLIGLLGLRTILVAINKLDLVGWSERRFAELRHEIAAYLEATDLPAPAAIVPISAREGAGISMRRPELSWYEGPTLLEALDSLPRPLAADALPLRLAVQDVYKFDERRIIAGRIESGQLRVGDRLLFSPSNKSARVRSIEVWNAPPITALGAGRSVGFTLDEPIFIERGEVASHVEAPPTLTDVFRSKLFWFGRDPMTKGARYRLKFLTREVAAEIAEIEHVIDTETLGVRSVDSVPRNAVAEVVIRTRGLLAIDETAANPRSGRFVLVDGYDIVAGGTIRMSGYADQRAQLGAKPANVTPVEHRVTLPERWRANRHKSGILWLTGLSGAGKSTLAIELERVLFAKGWQVGVVDGDNLRYGLNADLGFSPADRAENVRRAGEVSALLAGFGMLTISAFISPYRSDRQRIRAAYPELFHEVYVAAPLEVCESRDVKGLYRRARAGEIAEFTGISAPYEPPENPELVIHTDRESVDESVATLVAYVERRFKL